MNPLVRTGSRRVIAGGAAAAVVVTAVTAAAVIDSDDSSAAPEPPQGTATVTRQDLVETETVAGTLGFANARTLTPRRAGTLTWVASEGSTVKPGKTLYAIDGRRTVLMRGALPAYRTLSTGVEGADVRQLERGLRRMGYDGFTVDREYTHATAAAVREWQEDLGVPESGVVEPGDVVFTRGPVRIGAHQAEVGDLLSPGAPVIDISDPEQIVSIDLDVERQSLARKSAPVVVELPGGRRLTGRIVGVGTVASAEDSSQDETDGSQSGGSDDATVEVELKLDRPGRAGRLDQAPVDVELESERRDGVLTVPVTALLALVEGGYAVEVVEGARSRLVPVEVGMFADGLVEVRGQALREGTRVEVPSS